MFYFYITGKILLLNWLRAQNGLTVSFPLIVLIYTSEFLNILKIKKDFILRFNLMLSNQLEIDNVFNGFAKQLQNSKYAK